MVNPFDLKAALTAKHAQHVVLIHFPIALFIAGAAFDFLGQWAKNRALAAVAYWNFFAAALMSVPVLLTGLLAWQWQLEGQKLKGILLEHLIAGLTAAAGLVVTWLVLFEARRKKQAAPPVRFLLEAVGVIAVIVAGHLGGFVSGVNGSN